MATEPKDTTPVAKLAKLRERNKEVVDWPGFSVYFCVGRYAGFGTKRDANIYRITLGWVVIGLAACDLERFWGAVAQKLQRDGLVPGGEEP